MSTLGCTRAASAWKYCAEPISPNPPSRLGTTRALLLMFCALNGATSTPCRAAQRHRAVHSQLLPAPLEVPQTISALALIGHPPCCALRYSPWERPGGSFGAPRSPDAIRGWALAKGRSRIASGLRGSPRRFAVRHRGL